MTCGLCAKGFECKVRGLGLAEGKQALEKVQDLELQLKNIFQSPVCLNVGIG